ncbi:MAG: PRC and DUF2382 domain-containing protein, partial [Brachybacterium sp.]|nr:PRC and DUF2382 domain-containing protein [Brachybacterium sp.]
MTFQGDIKDLQTAEVLDSTGDKVGKVGQVYLTNDSQEPSWVTVNTGLFGTKETFIPLAEAQYQDGQITVPYEKSFIKDAPNVDEDGEISREQEDELYRYYGVQDPSTGGGNDRDRDRVHGDDRRDAGVAGAGAGAGAGLGADDRDRDGRRDGDLNDRDGRHDGNVDEAGKVTLHEEQLNVGTERVDSGKVRLRKHVVTETERVEVPVEREELVVERTPADGSTGGELQEGETEVTLSEERPVVDKQTVATEEVNVGKKKVQDTQTVQGEVAHE